MFISRIHDAQAVLKTLEMCLFGLGYNPPELEFLPLLDCVFFVVVVRKQQGLPSEPQFPVST